MTIRRFYVLSVFVPLLVLLLATEAGSDFGSVSRAFEPEIRSLRFDTDALAIPYLGLAWLALRRMRSLSEPEIVKLSLLAPFLFAAVVCLCVLALVASAALGGTSSVPGAGGVVLGMGLLALLAAAAYVLLVNSVLFVCYLARLVRRETRVVWLA